MSPMHYHSRMTKVIDGVIVPFYDKPEIPKHHDLELIIEKEKEISPSLREALDGVIRTGVTICRCRHAECRKKMWFVRYLYPGGWGPIGKVKKSRAVASLSARIKDQRESVWVYGSDLITSIKRKVFVK